MHSPRRTFRTLPRDVRILSIILYVFAAISLIGTAGMVVLYATNVPAFVFIIGFVFVPGAIAFLLGMLVPRGGVVVFWAVVVFGIGGALTALVSISAGVGSVILPMVFPAAILFFVFRRSTREHLLHA